MAMVRQKSRDRSQVQIRRKGWPYQTAAFRSKRAAEISARKIETDMDLGQFIDQTAARNTTLDALIECYLEIVAAKRPGEQSRQRCSRSVGGSRP